ncbi:MAG: hypothetical protein HPY54_12440 [Chthonomonadetes bacterium]|nr:hypothetical protein [Chthonomonadetes bacterium]
MRLARETWLLLALGLADLASTVYLVRHGLVREANPVMAWYLVHFGMWAFCAAKTTMLVCPLMILEWARRIKPYLGLLALRIAFIAYVALYLSIVWRANQAHLQQVFSPYLSRATRFLQAAPRVNAPAPDALKPMVMPVD